ncbi:MAG: hypothetical protein NTX48_11540 [Planctomycetales bacterium]|nr:hypothetical protein [Planctomycetales bacterium]
MFDFFISRQFWLLGSDPEVKFIYASNKAVVFLFGAAVISVLLVIVHSVLLPLLFSVLFRIDCGRPVFNVRAAFS